MRFGLREEELELILNVLRGFPEVEEAILFGSRAMATFQGNSDVDLAIKGAGLGLRDVIRLKGKLEELPLPYKFDVVEFGSVINEALMEQIEKYGKVLYTGKTSVEWVREGNNSLYGGKGPGVSRK